MLANTSAGDLDAAIAAIDAYAYQQKFLVNVGDRKGAILDRTIERTRPRRVLELGAYVGYSALRIARALPEGGHLYSVEFNPANAEIARRILRHAGVLDRVTVVVGSLGDGGKTLARLREELGFGPGSLDVVFIDHDKDAYVPDLQRILDAGWLHEGSVVVADNVGFPGNARVPRVHGGGRRCSGPSWLHEPTSPRGCSARRERWRACGASTSRACAMRGRWRTAGRTYRIIARGQPMMLINKKFPLHLANPQV